MSLKTIAIAVGFFSLIMGLLTYDTEIPTSPVPVVSGALVILLAVFGLIPELKKCPSCNKKNLKKATTCRHCGVLFHQDTEK
ncbi:MAG: zinc ribbon domain-containing protein [Proteobacteria bacterium]|nr:zinc ribbon domain-containing protein [Pseudomonadota bacterium]MBU1710314.1 zinc ribbon domain-containing protein [Pseudomonadota bacterium]